VLKAPSKTPVKAEGVNFTKLAATDRSDDIADFDDVPLAKSTIGKRARMNMKEKEMDVGGDADAEPPSRRLVGSVVPVTRCWFHISLSANLDQERRFSKRERRSQGEKG
jgi:hypothetical protein